MSLYEAYFGLQHDLRTLLGREVDLVTPAAVKNPFVQATIDRSRELVYGA